MKMMLVEWWFLLLAIPAIEGSLRIWKPKGFSREERVMKQIQETCYGDNDFTDLIIILGDFNEVFDTASVVQMNNISNVDPKYERGQLSNTKVTKVLIIEDSSEKLHSDLTLFQKTRWWNHMLPFFIIGKNDEKCENFKEMLNTTWGMDMINSIYICSGSETTTLYTLNPITNYAPDPWKRIKDLKDLNIYRQVFDAHTSCNNLNYDKTRVLNGYQIKSVVSWDTWKESMEELMYWVNKNPNARLFQLIMRQLNASVIYEQATDYNDLIYHLAECHSDVTHYGLFPNKMEIGLVSLFPLATVYRYVVIVKSTERTVLHKIRHLWSTQVLCLATISMTILFFILMMKNDGVTSAILDIIRFVTYVSMRTDMRSNSFRIYFTTMLILIVISNGVFQGKIAAFLTKPDKAPLIETVEQLKDSGYHFYVERRVYSKLLSWLHPTKSIVELTYDYAECIDDALDDPLIACIIQSYYYEQKYRLESLDRVRPRFDFDRLEYCHSRPNWPLYERFNYMLMRSIESGIYANLRNEEFYKINDKHKAEDNELVRAEIHPPYGPIKLVNLGFAFKLLAIGLSFATFALIIELKMREY